MARQITSGQRYRYRDRFKKRQYAPESMIVSTNYTGTITGIQAI